LFFAGVGEELGPLHVVMGAEACATAALAAASCRAVVPEADALWLLVMGLPVLVPEELLEPHPTTAVPIAASMHSFMTVFTDLSSS
jgi:hypothetical protein